VYPQGNTPDNWPQYDLQQPYPQGPYQPQQPPPYPPVDPYQLPMGYPGQQFPVPGNVRPSHSKTPLIIVGAVLGGLLLSCVVGVVVIALTPADNGAGPGVASSASATGTSGVTATPTSTGSPSQYDLEGDIDRYKEGDCLMITGADNEVKPANCTDAGALKVFLRREGVDVTTRQQVCDAVEDDVTDILYLDAIGTSEDLVLCVGPAK
jgi:hypothetical protein